MAIAKIILVDAGKMGDFYFTKDAEALARKYLNEGWYDIEATVEVPDTLTEEQVPEEMFDLTNNPYRQGEREVRYGRSRSVSVGDIVSVNGIRYLCRPNGWVVVDMATI
jgi:hypothetical protein